MSHAVLHHHHDFVPILRLVVLKLFVRTSQRIVPALQLRLANEDAAVRVRCGAKLQLEREVFRELLRRPELRNPAAFRRRGDNEPPVLRDVAALAADGLAIEVVRAISPAGQVATIK